MTRSRSEEDIRTEIAGWTTLDTSGPSHEWTHGSTAI
jgi:hypothetical protein